MSSEKSGREDIMKVAIATGVALLAAGVGYVLSDVFSKKSTNQAERVGASSSGSPTSDSCKDYSDPVSSYGSSNNNVLTPKEENCNICFYRFDKEQHYPIAFLPCLHEVCAKCS